MTDTQLWRRRVRPLKVRPGQIELAKLKVDLDKRLGRETPEVIKEIAKLG